MQSLTTELTFKDKILVIADLHLQSAEPDTITLAQAFLKQARGAKHLYIIGDLFEYWLGDDCLGDASCVSDALPGNSLSGHARFHHASSDLARSGHARSGHARSGDFWSDEAWSDDVRLDGIESGSLDETVSGLVTALATLSQSGTPITLMHGNRDFLLGDAFADEIGATLVREDVLALDRVILMHGDTLCTDDVEYQEFRAQVRDAQWQSDFLAKPLKEREAIANALRSGSRNASQQKATAIMDVNTDAVDQTFNQFGCQHLIHGHTHRPAIHQHESGTRMVVGDWHADHAMVGIVEGGEIELLKFTASLFS